MSEHQAPSFVAIAHDFTRHPKIIALSRGQQWTWLELLCYSVEHRTDGRVVPRDVRKVIPKLTPLFVQKCVAIGLLDEKENGELFIHNYDLFNGSKRARFLARERKRRQRERESMSRESHDHVTLLPVTSGHVTHARVPLPQDQEQPPSTQTAQAGSQLGRAHTSARGDEAGDLEALTRAANAFERIIELDLIAAERADNGL